MRNFSLLEYTYRPSRIIERNYVHYNHPFKIRKCINKSFWLSIGWVICGFLPRVAMDKLQLDGCDRQVFFYWVAALTIEPTLANIFFCNPNRYCHTQGIMDWCKETTGFGFEYSSNTQLRLIFLFFSFLIPLFSPKANTIICILYPPDSHMYVQWLKLLV